eukprot:SAG22_NODE_242_length_14104_cov_13.581935_8_plen_206_part_00
MAVRMPERVRSRNPGPAVIPSRWSGPWTTAEARDYDGWTALIGASYNGHTEAVPALLAAGSAVGARNRGSKTVLFWAERRRHQAGICLATPGWCLFSSGVSSVKLDCNVDTLCTNCIRAGWTLAVAVRLDRAQPSTVRSASPRRRQWCADRISATSAAFGSSASPAVSTSSSVAPPAIARFRSRDIGSRCSSADNPSSSWAGARS